MNILTFEKVGVSFGARTLFRDVSFSLDEKDRLGIVGVNGAGKSTLLRLIAEHNEPDNGTVYINKDISIGMLAQNPTFAENGTVYQTMLLAFSSLLKQEKQIESLQHKLDTQTAALAEEERISLACQYTALCDRFRQEGGYIFRARTRSMLLSAGFSEDMFSLPITDLSGGQRTRLCLVRLLLGAPQLLLLDEPTNHLDFSTLSWLESEIRAYPGAVMVISHDRYFLDRVTNKTLCIENECATLYQGNYTAYVAKKKQDLEIAEKHYKNQQREIARIEAYIAKQRQWNRERNIIAAESRQKMLDKMVRLEQPKQPAASVQISFDTDGQTGQEVLILENLTKSYPGHSLFSQINTVIHRQERVFVLGPNGCGKSTFLKILAGRLMPDAGTFRFGYRTQIGYYDQEQQELNPNNTVLEELWEAYHEKNEVEIRSLLARFLFFADDMEKKISALSGGERARLTLCKLILAHANVLILDEPTNHLDIPSREALEDALLAFPGTLIIVSHDRYFIDKLATRIFELNKGFFADYRDTYQTYLARKTESRTILPPAEKKKAGKEEYIRQKELQAQRRKYENAKRRIHESCEKIEARITAIDAEAKAEAAFDYLRLSELYAEKEELENQLLSLYEESEALQEQSF